MRHSAIKAILNAYPNTTPEQTKGIAIGERLLVAADGELESVYQQIKAADPINPPAELAAKEKRLRQQWAAIAAITRDIASGRQPADAFQQILAEAAAKPATPTSDNQRDDLSPALRIYLDSRAKRAAVAK